jgi:hypothetical protein
MKYEKVIQYVKTNRFDDFIKELDKTYDIYVLVNNKRKSSEYRNGVDITYPIFKEPKPVLLDPILLEKLINRNIFLEDNNEYLSNKLNKISDLINP